MTQWNLSALCTSIHHAKERIQDIDSLVQQAKQLDIRTQLPVFLETLERIYTLQLQVSAYAHLRQSLNSTDEAINAFLSQLDQHSVAWSDALLHQFLAIKQMDEQTYASIRLPDFGYYLDRLRAYKTYTKSDAEERILQKVGPQLDAFEDIYDLLTSHFRYTIDDKTYTESEIRALIYDTNALTRKKAYEQMYSVVESNKHVLFELYKQTVLSWKATGQDIRGHPSALHTRTFSQDIDESLIHTMLSVCQEKKDIFHAYFKKKAELLGTPTLSRFDMYAPLFADKQEINYQQACEMVTQSYTQFSPEFGKIVKDIIQAHHIDVYPQAYKRGGAFCYYTPQNVLPYILLNYTNTIRDVTTLAHELGHAIHDVLCNKQSILVAHPPISLAETASIFGEELMFDRLLSDTPHTQALLASYIDDAYASIIRQAYFVLFEIKAHQAIAQGATLTQVSDIYYALLQEQYGEHVHIPKQFAYEFLMIPHIYHTPFYCFGYSFGNLLTLALYEQYKEQPDGFVQKYTTLLSSGGSASPQTITQQAGFDITQRAFWQKAFVLLEQRINMFLQSQ